MSFTVATVRDPQKAKIHHPQALIILETRINYRQHHLMGNVRKPVLIPLIVVRK